MKNSDSATYYNRLGYNNSVLIKDDESKYLFVLNEGANLIITKKYKIAIDSINKALPKMIQYQNTMNIIAGYYYLGKVNERLGIKKLAVNNYIKVDSIYQKNKQIFPEMTDGYSYLIEHYKLIGNKEAQLKYLATLMSIDSAAQKKYRNLDKVIRKKYEIPHLLEKKESIIQSLEGKNKIAFWSILTLILLSLSLGSYTYYQNKNYKLRFEKLINESQDALGKSNDKSADLENEKLEVEKGVKDIGIPTVIIEDVLSKLADFEQQNSFLNREISIQYLAFQFESNSKYVSKIVNQFKQKSFTQYINDLRIDYAVKALQKDNLLVKYSINALASEFGFNTAESFSNAFYKKTGLKNLCRNRNLFHHFSWEM